MHDIIAFDSSMVFKNLCLNLPLAKIDKDGNVLFDVGRDNTFPCRLLSIHCDLSDKACLTDVFFQGNDITFICVSEDLTLDNIELIQSLSPDICCLVSLSASEFTRKTLKEKFGSAVITYLPEYLSAEDFKTIAEFFAIKKNSKKLEILAGERDVYKNGILGFIQLISEVRNAEIHTSKDLYAYLLTHTMGFFRAEHGAFISLDKIEDSIDIEYASDKFEGGEDFFSQVGKAVEEQDIVICGNRTLVPLRMAGQTEYILAIDNATNYKENFIFNSILRSIALICNNSILTHNIDAISKEEKINTLDSISNTINHYANNALAAVKGFALELEHVDDIDIIKRNLKFIYDSCNVVEAVIKTLTSLSYEDLHNTIDIPILHLSIINIETKLHRQLELIKAEDEKLMAAKKKS